ncbi:MAG: M56 family metallopeptidase [Verrucomicrobiota bacterium]
MREQPAKPPRDWASLPWPKIAFGLWIAVVVTILGYRMIGWLGLSRMRKRSAPETDPAWLSSLSAMKKRLGLRQRIALRRSQELSAPITFGVIRPVVLLPASPTSWDEKRKTPVLLHELAHIKRRDWLTQTLGQLACAVHWFNPLSWWLLRQMQTSREFACDDLTIAKGAVPSDYAAELLHFVEASREKSASPVAVSMARPSNIEERIRRIIRNDRTRIALTVATILVAIIGCAVVLLPLASMQTESSATTQSGPVPSLLKNEAHGAADRDGAAITAMETESETIFSATRAGISEAIRAGNLEAIKAILTEKPELLNGENPYNWANLEEMRVWPWASKPVELAVVFDHPDILAYLLSITEATKDQPLKGYFEAFDIARKAKNEAAIEVLVADVLRRADRPGWIHATTDSGRTFLHFAAGYEHVGLMESLLARGADPDARQKNGKRPIYMVAGDNDATRLLLRHGAEFDLWVAAAMGDLGRARELLAEDPSRVAFDYAPFSHHSDGLPMVVAATHGHLEMVNLLLENGADVDGKLEGREFGDLGFGLIIAFSKGHYDVVNLLLDHGADTEAWTDSDHGFKRRVRDSDHQQIKDRVLTPEEQNPPVQSPGFVAWTGELHGDIRQLPPPTPEGGLGTISAAIVSHNRHNDYANYKEIITVMLEQGADQNAWMKTVTDEERTAALKKRYWHREFGTPLHWLSTAYLNKANYSPNPDIPTVEELVDLAGLFVDYDANLEARHPISNHTPLSSAVAEGIYDYVDFLLEKGARIHRSDPPKTNPVLIAEQLGLTKIAKRLAREAP